MRIPRRGEVVAFVAKAFDVQLGDKQRKAGRMKEGTASFETANDVAKTLVRGINQLIYPGDTSSPAERVELRMSHPVYQSFANAAEASGALDLVWRDAMKFFMHHSEIARSIEEVERGRATEPNLSLEIYLYFFVLPVVANNLVKYETLNRTFAVQGLGGYDREWFLPSYGSNSKHVTTPFAKALSWFRQQLGPDSTSLEEVLCPGQDRETASRQIERWRSGAITPSSERIEKWAKNYRGNKMIFRVIFHLCAATTRIVDKTREAIGGDRTLALVEHLKNLITVVRGIQQRNQEGFPALRGQPESIVRCLGWLYGYPDRAPIGPDYRALVIEMQSAFVTGVALF